MDCTFCLWGLKNSGWVFSCFRWLHLYPWIYSPLLKYWDPFNVPRQASSDIKPPFCDCFGMVFFFLIKFSIFATMGSRSSRSCDTSFGLSHHLIKEHVWYEDRIYPHNIPLYSSRVTHFRGYSLLEKITFHCSPRADMICNPWDVVKGRQGQKNCVT